MEVGQIIAEYCIRAARLAGLLFGQPSGGPAVGAGKPNLQRNCQASWDQLQPYWTDWCAMGDDIPTSKLGTAYLETELSTTRFPCVPGALQPKVSEEFATFMAAHPALINLEGEMLFLAP